MLWRHDQRRFRDPILETVFIVRKTAIQQQTHIPSNTVSTLICDTSFKLSATRAESKGI